MTPLLLALALTASIPASPPSPRQLAITGSSRVTFRPNQVVASFQLDTQHRDAAGARRAIEERLRKVLAALEGAGVSPQNVISNVGNVGAQYRGNEVVGHAAAAVLSVTLTDMSRVDEALAAALKAGANPTGVLIANTDHERFENQARVAAAAAARERAAEVLRALGARVGLPAAVNDQTPVAQQVSAGTFVASADGKVHSGLASRELEVTSQVSVRFDIDPPN